MTVGLYLILFCLAIFSFWKGKYTTFLLCYFGICTSFFMLDKVVSESTCADICILLNLCILPLLPKRYAINGGVVDKCHNLAFSTKNDSFALAIWVYLGFILCELILTIISGAEHLLNGVKVVRISLLFLLYFIVKSIPAKNIDRFIHYGLYITLAQSFLYYLQFAGIHILSGFDTSQLVNRIDISYLNIPILTFFYVFYCLQKESIGKIRFIYVLFLSGTILLSSARTWIIAYGVGLLLYLVLRKNLKQTILVAAFLLLLAPVAIHSFAEKDYTSRKSMKEDLSNLLNNADALDMMDSGSGTMTFRIAMLYERFNYLLENPRYMAFGVGTIHEDSPKCAERFDFLLGTKNEGRLNGRCMIESGDIAWAPILLRYGIVGLLLSLAILLQYLVCGIKRKDDLMIIASVAVIQLITTMSGPFFESGTRIYVMVLLMGWAARIDLEKQLVNDNE